MMGERKTPRSGYGADEAAMTIAFEESVRFPAPDGEVEVPAGEYGADVAGDGSLRLITTDAGREWRIPGSPTWHDFPLTSPLALCVPGEGEERHVLLMFPGGTAVSSVGLIRGRADARAAASLPIPMVAEHVVTKAMRMFGELPFERSMLTSPSTRALWGTIEPGLSPSPFFPPAGMPPHWIGATVATAYGGPGQPGQPTPPGSPVRRGAFPGYLVSVTPVTADWPLSMVGRVVQLHVTSHVISLGLPTILFATWTDVYQVVPQTTGPVSFPEVIVATGRVPAVPAPPGTSWSIEVAKRFTSASGQGAPTGFELRVDGVTVGTRDCQFKGAFPGSPALSCP